MSQRLWEESDETSTCFGLCERGLLFESFASLSGLTTAESSTFHNALLFLDTNPCEVSRYFTVSGALTVWFPHPVSRICLC